MDAAPKEINLDKWINLNSHCCNLFAYDDGQSRVKSLHQGPDIRLFNLDLITMFGFTIMKHT